METIDLCGGTQGSIWGRKPLPKQKDGFVLGISNTRVGLTAKGRRVPFTKVAFGSHGSWFVSVDQHGTLYSFDLARNKYQTVHRLGQTCTALLCSHAHPNEVFIASVDTNVHCINIDTKQVLNTFGPHEASVKSLSLHQNGRLLLVATVWDSVLWDVHTGRRYRTLSGGETVGVLDVFFLPLSNSILTCFRDDSIHAWEADTLEYKYDLPLPSGGPSPRYRAFTVTSDGSTLVGWGQSLNVLHVWEIVSRSLKQVVELPPKMRKVQSLFFVPGPVDEGAESSLANNILALQSQDGIIRFINMLDCKPLFQLGSIDQPLVSAVIDSIGRNVVAINQQGDLYLFDIFDLLRPQESTRLVLELEDSTPSTCVSPTPLLKSPRTNRQSRSKTPSTQSRNQALSTTPNPHLVSEVGGVKVNLKKLRAILKGYGEYPAKYRSFIWRSLLQLPDNHSAYSVLVAKGTHPAFARLQENYPIKSPKLLRILQRVLSAVAHWSTLFAEVDYLPAFVFPFVKFFQNNQLVAFEVVATILFNWCGQWFDYFPNPPYNILTMVENLLSYHDPHLLNHLILHKINVKTYVWPLLSTIFSEVLSREEWLQLCDNILSNHPSFLLLVTSAYISAARQTLMNCTTPEDVEHFIHHPSSVNLKFVLQDAYRMQEGTPTEIHPRKLLEEFSPLTKGTYPVFNKYPTFVVDYQLKEREKIMKEEQEHIRQRQQMLELERLAEQRRRNDENWQRQQQLLTEAEEERRKMVTLEDQKLSDQRARLAAMKRESRMKELKALDEARNRYLEQQQIIRENEIRRMDKEIQRKILLRDRETNEAIQDTELRTLELQAQRARIEQELAQRHDKAMYRVRKDYQTEQDRLMEPDAPELESSSVSNHCDPANTTGTSNSEGLRDARITQARIDAERMCREDEQVAQAHCDLLRLRGELKDQELRERTRMCEMEEERLKTTMGHLHDNTDSTSMKTDTLSSVSAIEQLTNYQDEVVRWSEQRQRLDQQEAELLTKINNLRRKVATRMMDTSLSLKDSSNTDQTSF